MLPIFGQRRFLLGTVLLLVLLVYVSHNYLIPTELQQCLPDFHVSYTPATSPVNLGQPRNATLDGMLSGIGVWQRASEIRNIMGLVFYDRRETASILDCYLKVRW